MNKRIRKFVGTVAHDLRGPLGKLINTSEILLSGVEPEAVNTFYKIMSQTSRRGFDLVNDLLDITALETGLVRLNAEDCDLKLLAQRVIAELGYLAAAKEINLVNNMVEPLVAKADTRRIFQVLVNLINNAVKFTPRSGMITLLAIEEDSGIKISVCDSGVGIPPEKLGDLFLKHEKISTPGTEGEPGTGFGLALAQEIVQGHGSSIEVDSELGKGSCFSFILPLWE